MIRRPIVAVLLTVCCLGTVSAACGKDTKNSESSLLELRPVLSSTAPPCPAKPPKKSELVVPKTTDGKVDECLELGPAIIDAKDVRSATEGETTSKEPTIFVVLGGVGGANLDGFAQRNLGKRLAIMADGQLVNAPEVRYSSFAGRIQITGLSKEKTDDLFRRLNDFIKG